MPEELEAVVDAPAAETPAVETPAHETPGGEPAATPKTYNEQQVSEIVQKRLKDWDGLKPAEVRQQLTEYQTLKKEREEMAARLSGKQPDGAKAETPEDRAFREYMEGKYPALKDMASQQQAMNFLFQERARAITEKNTESLRGMAKEAGFPEKSFQAIDDLTAESIRRTPADLKAYQMTGDPAIVKKHFGLVKEQLSGVVVAQNAEAAKAAGKKGAVAPRLPAGGVPAQTSKTRKLSDKERISAAFDAYVKPE